MAIIVTDNKSCFSIYRTEQKWLHSTFKGVVNYDLIIEHLENGQRFSKKNEIYGALVDLRTLRGSYYKLFDYLEYEAYPKLKSSGLRNQAFIISDDLITANVTEKLMQMFARLDITAKMFTNLNEAKYWLTEQVKP